MLDGNFTVEAHYMLPSVHGPRSGHTLQVLDDHLVVFGGYDGSRRRKDVLSVSLKGIEAGEPGEWRRSVCGEGVRGRAGHVAVQCGDRQSLLFGGYTTEREDRSDAMWLLQTARDGEDAAGPASSSETASSHFTCIPAQPRAPSSSAFSSSQESLERRWAAAWGVGRWESGHQVFVHGGWNRSGKSGALYRTQIIPIEIHQEDNNNNTLDSHLTISSWELLKTQGEPPSSRRWHQALPLDPTGATALVYGGYDGDALADWALLDAETLRWSRCAARGEAPQARCRAGLVRLGRKRVLCFGGYGSSAALGRRAETPLRDAWVLTTDDMQWRRVPMEREGFMLQRAGMAVFQAADGDDAKAWVFGGYNAANVLCDDLLSISV